MSTWQRIMRGVLLSLLLVLSVGLVHAQDDETAVYGVFFYLPTCSHCHEVMTEAVPQWEAEFDGSLQLLYVDVSVGLGSELFEATCTELNIDNCSGVPMLVVGDEVMLGSREIPERMPDIVRDGLEQGGIGLPEVPLLVQTYADVVGADDGVVVEPVAEDYASGDSDMSIAWLIDFLSGVFMRIFLP